ncbi:VanW family protein [Mycolicibacterium sp. PAM1]|uniref:VanW family protein n=1 Tax=Mycolicibacterium gilvum (strain PYR-GCK) TaxID=350054 RepID=A4T1F8_MYCGI|nr:VanW family protein [Mycolicibacterium sp. PAM1]ABP47653.1 VanW family protein [Mycolicibacterium gilvum PYR-GCK]MBV5246069.1 VanW family protein [Mycolicibacterium sp. PAM1]
MRADRAQPKVITATAPAGPARPRRRRLLWTLIAAPFALLAVAYIGDLLYSKDRVVRGVTAAGVPIGGLTLTDAEDRLRAEVSPRATRPIPVTAGPARDEIDPASAGLTVDWRATVEQSGAQPVNPITRLTSLFETREIGVVSTAADDALTAALDRLDETIAKDPVEGTVRFDGREPVAVDPENGLRLDVDTSADLLKRDWATGRTIDLPIVEPEPATTASDVQEAIDDVAAPAVSAPLVITGDDDTRATVDEDVIAAAMTFDVEDGDILATVDENVIVDAARPQLADSETPRRDATLDFAASPPAKVPSEDGRRIDYDETLTDVMDALTSTDDREIAAVYVDDAATFTTEDIEKLGPVEVIGEFQTSGFSGASGRNIKRAAEAIDGIVVAPGETFSLNGATNPRTAANGYVESGIILNGRPDTGVGGGVSQVATTLFNAAYFAGMDLVEHQEHSYYISRYPAGREATVFGDEIDVKFRNDGPTPVQIQTTWTSSAITVQLVGIKRYEVSSAQSPRSKPTSPRTITIPAGESCSASGGAPGFTITDTRTLRDIVTGDIRTESHTVRYDPIPKVVCGG